MSLRDTACYTLTLIPSKTDPKVLELVETVSFGKQEAKFARVREGLEGEVYTSSIYDVFSGARLAGCGYVTDKSKSRRLQLYGPDVDVPFDFSGRLGFEWTFQFEGNKYKWTKSNLTKDFVCSLDRKPDPSVEICLARDSDKDRPGQIQILHYNIERFPDEIKDLRGLETLLVASLMCFLDTAEERSNSVPTKVADTLQRPPLPAKSSSASSSSSLPPAPQEPVRVISAEDFEPENPNEIIVGMNSDIDGHISRAVGLLEDPAVLFIVIRTKSPQATQRALEVSLGVTRYRHHESLPDLHQYVIEEDLTSPTASKPGPKIIKLDDEPKPVTDKNPKNWTPPPNITIYLSTIELPDLKPTNRRRISSSSSKASNPPPQTVPGKGNVLPPIHNRPSSSMNPGAHTVGHGKESGDGSGDGKSGEKKSGFGRLLKPDWL